MRSELENLPQGWFHHGERILEMLDVCKPRVCVELGTWRGASAIAIARCIRKWGGILYCIDTWMGDVNGGLMPGVPQMLTECVGNMVYAGVAPSIRLVPARTSDAAEVWQGSIDFLYIDADHSYSSVAQDLMLWWPKLRNNGGLIAGDDYLNPLYPGVQKAWDEFEKVTQPFERFATPDTKPAGMQLIYGVKR